MPYDEEVLLPFSALRSAIPPVTRCKSTLLVSSLRTLKETGHYARYAELLDPGYRDVVLECVAGVWLPIELKRTRASSRHRQSREPHSEARAWRDRR